MMKIKIMVVIAMLAHLSIADAEDRAKESMVKEIMEYIDLAKQFGVLNLQGDFGQILFHPKYPVELNFYEYKAEHKVFDAQHGTYLIKADRWKWNPDNDKNPNRDVTFIGCLASKVSKGETMLTNGTAEKGVYYSEGSLTLKVTAAQHDFYGYILAEDKSTNNSEKITLKGTITLLGSKHRASDGFVFINNSGSFKYQNGEWFRIESGKKKQPPE